MLGSVADAEDVVQETFVRWREAGEPALRSARAWFTRTCTRLAVDRVRALQRRREEYVGEWLPEPLLADASDARAELDDTLSMALLATVQRLPPKERAAFLLHDVFGYSFAEIGEILDLQSAHCRQLAVRARRHLGGEARHDADVATVRRLNDAFFAAVGSGDLERLGTVLAADVVLHSDGGGKVAAARRPIAGAAAVARFFERVFRPARGRIERREAWFNGGPGTLVYEEGVLVSAFQLRLVGDRIASIFVQRNPDKLARLDSPGAT